MPTDTWPLDSPMLPPLVLRPPHGPRIARLLVMVLAVIFYLPPAGWSPITNGPEGELAAAAQELLNHGGWVAPGATALLDGPLTLWLTRISLDFFGANACAARLPAAFGSLLAVWFTLRLAERFGTIWQGLVAGLLLLCSPGMFTLGRLLTPIPLTAALVTVTVYCLQRGAEPRPRRRRWLLLAWGGLGLATLAGGWRAAAVPVGMVMLLALFFPEARLRFRPLLCWEGALAFGLTLLAMLAAGFPPWGNLGGTPELTKPLWQVVFWQGPLLFPWSLLLLPALAVAPVRWFSKKRPLEWNEALPLAWLAAGCGVVAIDPSRTLFSPLLFWPAFAVWGAGRLKTMHHQRFLGGCAGIAAAACSGLFLTQRLRLLLSLFFPEHASTFTAIPEFFWPSVTPVAFIALLAFVLFVGAAFGAEVFQNRRFALLALFAALIPAGFAFADIGAKFAGYFSDEAIARSLQERHETPQVIFVDASRLDASSLWFYLDEETRARLHPCGTCSELEAAWKPGACLVTTRTRLAHWSAKLKGNFSVVGESGVRVVLSAQAQKR